MKEMRLYGWLVAVVLALSCMAPALAFAAETDFVAATQAAGQKWERLGGADAFATMSEVVDEAYPQRDSCDTVVLATSDGYWDALTASGLAGLYGCPVLLTDAYSLPQMTRYQIARLGASKVVIAGGNAAVSPVIDAQLKLIRTDMKVTRAKGDDAVATALDIYNKGKSVAGGWSKTAIVATNRGYWDALSASPYSFARKAPVFLASEPASKGVKLRSDVLSAIKAGGFTKVYICGGTAAVSSDVEKQLSGITVKRLAGATAIDTSQAVARECIAEGMDADGMCVATSEGYWDGLTGAALAGTNNAPLILAAPRTPSTATSGIVTKHKAQITRGFVLGGPAAVPAATLSALESTTK